MSFGKRFSDARKKKNISQEELAKILQTKGPAIARNERDEMKPSIEVASKIDDVLEASLDYLIGNTDLLREKTVVDKIVGTQKLNSEDRAHVFALLDAFLQSHKAKKVFAS
jgi:transcriptional regulator with XRE-family HTH domain